MYLSRDDEDAYYHVITNFYDYVKCVRKWKIEVHQSAHPPNFICEHKKIQFYSILYILMIGLLPGIHSKLVEVPRNAVVWESSTINTTDMACKSDYQYRLKWDVYKNNDYRKDVLYNGFFLHPDARSYCTVVADEPGKYYLRLKNTAEAAKTYICVEPGSLSEASADLIWINNDDPICNKSSTEHLVSLRCSIEFRGNWAPTMEWKEQSNDGEKVLTLEVNTVTVPNQSVTSTVVMKVQKGIRNYTCTTKFAIGGKPLHTTATNVPDYNRVWTASLSPRTEDETVEDEMEDTRLILPLIIGFTSAILLLSTVVILICVIKRKTVQEVIEKQRHEEISFLY